MTEKPDAEHGATPPGERESLTCRLPRAVVLASCIGLGACRSEPGPSPPPPVGRACTEIGCGPGISVRFDRRPPCSYADYRVEVIADERTITCETKMPLLCDATPSCSDPSVTLEEIGCALAIGEQSLGGVSLANVPRALTVRVFEGETLLAEGAWTPEARTSRPNGPECEPECVQAPDVTLVLPPAP
jgi:hypothetical protein